MNALRDALDFELEINRPTDGGLWGSEVEPGNFTGLSGDITQNKTDIGFADIFIKLENLKHMDYTYPYFTEWVCYLVIYSLCNNMQRDSLAHSFCSLSKGPDAKRSPKLDSSSCPFTTKCLVCSRQGFLNVTFYYYPYFMVITPTTRFEKEVRVNGYLSTGRHILGHLDFFVLVLQMAQPR